MSRGTTIKQDTPQRQTLTRPMVTRRYELVVDHAKCCGCQICVKVCPQEAIALFAAELAEGRLTRKPRVDIDPAKCTFCGECVVLCPTHALSLTVNGEREIPVLKGEAFPMLIRANKVNLEICRATHDTRYVEACPVGAIRAEIIRDAAGQVVAVQDVAVEHELCINCTRCMEEGPAGAFTVTKPYKGQALLNIALCPPGCQACADVCPTHAITYDGEKVVLDQRFCLFCSACENVCPVEGAVRIVRTGLVHTPIASGAWVAALEKLVSFREAVRELDIKGQQKRRKLLIRELTGEAPAGGCEG